MRKILTIFFKTRGAHPLLVLACLLLSGLAEGVSLSALLPTIAQIGNHADHNVSGLSTFILDGLAFIGVQPALDNLISVVFLAMVLRAILSFLALSYAGIAVARVATGLRMRLLDRLMSARWSYFTDQRVGVIANAISVQAKQAGDAYFMATKFVSLIVQGVVYAVIAIFISPLMAFGGLAIGGVLSVTLSRLIRISRRAGYRQTDRTSQLVTYVCDAFNNIKPIKSMDRQAAFSKLFETKINALRKALKRRVIAGQGLVYGREILVALVLGASVYVTADIMQVPLAELVVLGIVFFQLISITGKIQNQMQLTVEQEGAYWRLQNLTADAAAECEIDDGVMIPSLRHDCTFRNVSLSHGDRSVIRNVSLTIPAGGITVLQGPSGAGKTTIIDLLIGLYVPDEGDILIDGTPLKDISLNAWRRMIGYVPQELSLLHGTIYENVTLGDNSISREKVNEALKKANALTFVNALPDGLDTMVGEQGARLSGGQRQRISLARALAGDPKIIILDEVTSALDPKTEAEICRNIQALAGGYTIVSITHRKAWTMIATRLYRVEDGCASLYDNLITETQNV